MTRVILLTFGFMSWAWYELSGGADFVPGNNGVQLIAVYEPTETPEPVQENVQPQVARANMGSELTTFEGFARQQRVYEFDNAQPIKTVLAPVAARAIPAEAVIEQVAVRDQGKPGVTVASSIDYREVTGSRVNLRGGPGTSYNVVTQLLRGEEVEIMDETGDGWVKLRALDGNDIGWMSDSFLTAAQ
ncbi:SH3 domain-containing protein [Tropicibacter naphthalenivorans]|uniref:SH3 domain protein n=1 Tax=Tropicibacter naphthalenivorans TaxID=441103 RepID=A0A0P1GTJ2_9RHOB|nr:SH3 domain-containing protein [Tropicibacter naphthalenivorans]CUH78952.1 SH3 domain protein [Tropicibacter naphthalenivorans]SMD04161.1 SH3 domain-containing protein [Tropicibacter naphthalenivorans]